MGGLPVKPKLQGYVAQELFDEFERYKTIHSLSQSRALEKLLAEYFGKPSASTLPPEEAIAVTTLRSELAELKLELTQRLQVLEDRLANSSAVSSAVLGNGLTEVSADELAKVSADESANKIAELIDVTTPVEPIVSAANLVDESAVAEGVIAVPEDVSAISSVDESAMVQSESAPLEESIDESVTALDESADESAKGQLESASELVSALDESAIESATESATEQMAKMSAILSKGLKEIAVEEATISSRLPPMNATGLGKRLGVHQSSVSKQKDNGNELFKKWSAKKDPQGIAWEYRPEAKGHFKYFPIEPKTTL